MSSQIGLVQVHELGVLSLRQQPLLKYAHVVMVQEGCVGKIRVFKGCKSSGSTSSSQHQALQPAGTM